MKTLEQQQAYVDALRERSTSLNRFATKIEVATDACVETTKHLEEGLKEIQATAELISEAHASLGRALAECVARLQAEHKVEGVLEQ